MKEEDAERYTQFKTIYIHFINTQTILYMTCIKKINTWTIVRPVNIIIVVTPEEKGLWNAAGDSCK